MLMHFIKKEKNEGNRPDRTAGIYVPDSTHKFSISSSVKIGNFPLKEG